MHISKVQNTILTKCTNMSEESHRRYGMNGAAERIPKECHKPNYGQGGRLKFFKDGKFILELARAREGERVSWVSVQRKTFWPPPGPTSSTPAYRQESSTSLSVSDDNSSIQSSPWQRDHSWKQTMPKRNISQEMVMFFWRPKSKRCPSTGGGGSWGIRRRRRPLSTVQEEEEHEEIKVRKGKKRQPLLNIVQTLLEKTFRASTPPRPETVVSPRKRFLMEMERERTPSASSSPTSDWPSSSEDGSTNSAQKRSRVRSQIPTGRPASRTPPCALIKTEPGESLAQQQQQQPVTTGTPVRSNGVIEETPVNSPKASRNCSYSITSLLAEDHHKNNLRSSPSNSPSRFSPVVSHIPTMAASPGSRYCSHLAVEDRLYSESVDKLRSIELSQVEKCGYPPPYAPPLQHYLAASPSPYLYPFPNVPPPYYAPHAGIYGGNRAPQYLVPQPIYPHHHPQHHHHHLVAPQAVAPPPLRRDPTPPKAAWASGHPPTDRGHGRDVKVEAARDENGADMPLNLSKHPV
ncbi:uncharacterized protein LOC126734840 isoform X2 [Anthonomus grandis grandis]|uniref:uncharacterized protein LOC126734840 isoform X2 n=1 Tax=Anthonomus grandis grandis TaxID=2921223 RepID=UPI0021659824|nr:uncharacterized protein LOC126734840 isoform X2 [Anthonomus grandis grandis]